MANFSKYCTGPFKIKLDWSDIIQTTRRTVCVANTNSTRQTARFSRRSRNSKNRFSSGSQLNDYLFVFQTTTRYPITHVFYLIIIIIIIIITIYLLIQWLSSKFLDKTRRLCHQITRKQNGPCKKYNSICTKRNDVNLYTPVICLLAFTPAGVLVLSLPSANSRQREQTLLLQKGTRRVVSKVQRAENIYIYIWIEKRT